ncbi:MAG: RIP metalloprotease RseP [Rhodocyclaceae bacterium]
MSFFWYLGAFALALGVLIVVHELGHYLVARAAGVKVLRFSVGFGKPLFARRVGADGTEWAIAAFPLGGYVKMLDEREDPVPAAELHRAFNRQNVWKRIAIVSAGPVANLLLAIALYWGLYLYGVQEVRPLTGAPPAGSMAEAAGIAEGELVVRVNGKPVQTWQELRWELTQLALQKVPVRLETANEQREIVFRNLDLSRIDGGDLDSDLLNRIGLKLARPNLPAIIGKVAAGSVAEGAGMQEGDRVVAADGKPVATWLDVVGTIRAAPGRPLVLEWLRGERRYVETVVPDEVSEKGARVGRIGVAVRDDPEVREKMLTLVRYGPLDGLLKATEQTWDTAIFSLKIFGRMLMGEVSWRNLSGPVTIADYAGQSAQMGPSYYLRFLAAISISLGVLNLLPIPILDGGHLMYYMVEIIKGGPLSERAMEIGQQVGLALLMMLMAFALYNDFNRLLSG